MKNKNIFLSVSLLAVMTVLFCPNVFADSPSLYPNFVGKTVKVYVADIKKSADTDIDVSILKQKILASMADRKSIKFQAVDKAQNSDITINGDLTGFFWTDHDPVDMIIGAAAVAMDAALVEDYASMEGYFEVLDSRSGKIIWKGSARGNITKQNMSRPESVPLVSDQLAQSFVRVCFAKTKKDRR